MPLSTEKITRQQQERRAYVYIRQSTQTQVRHHRTSQDNQYALVERAQTLGWPRERIFVIDADLGQSGQNSARHGFQELVSAVSLGQVGIILAYEASRLARNNADWYRLRDLAAMMGALLADTDGVYDPRTYNDRLLLGLRGIMSEAEWHLLQLRMQAGRRRQIEQGTYRQTLPTGRLRLPDGRVIKDPDQQIQDTLTLVLERFAVLGSCQKVLRSLRDDGVLLPRRQPVGRYAGELWWKRPSAQAVYAIIHTPAYAGAFVHGRTQVHRERQPGTPGRYTRQPMAEWKVVHQDVYPAYISWEHFMRNQEQLADNASAFDRRARGAPRDGSALLAGLVVCGRCGHQMRVAYQAHPHYRCNALAEDYREPQCLSLKAAGIDAAVGDAFFAALAPAELDLLEDVVTAEQRSHEQVTRHYADQVKRTEYEARLAQRQYQAVDPENRLVAAELERRWEVALRALVAAKDALERFTQLPPGAPLDPGFREQLHDLGQQLPVLWATGTSTEESSPAELDSPRDCEPTYPRNNGGQSDLGERSLFDGERANDGPSWSHPAQLRSIGCAHSGAECPRLPGYRDCPATDGGRVPVGTTDGSRAENRRKDSPCAWTKSLDGPLPSRGSDQRLLDRWRISTASRHEQRVGTQPNSPWQGTRTTTSRNTPLLDRGRSISTGVFEERSNT
jgi:DNA invertase Pin-like site-specific DNA recombinase